MFKTGVTVNVYRVSVVGSEKESTIGALGEESFSELMEALPDPDTENVFSDSV